MKLKSNYTKTLALCLVALSLSSCIEVLEVIGALSALSSAPMPLVRAELGQPVWSGKNEQGFDVDRFRFQPLASPTPIDTSGESLSKGTDINITVTYDAQKRVAAVEAFDHEGKRVPLHNLRGIGKLPKP